MGAGCAASAVGVGCPGVHQRAGRGRGPAGADPAGEALRQLLHLLQQGLLRLAVLRPLMLLLLLLGLCCSLRGGPPTSLDRGASRLG